MKRVLIGLALLVAAAAAFAQDPVTVFEKPFRAPSPATVGQGGSFTANAYGYDSFFNNPAGMAGKGSFTLMSVNPWLYSTGEMLQFVSDTAGLSGAAKTLPADWVTITVTFPATYTLPEGYTGSQADFEAEMSDVFNELVYEAGLTSDELAESIIIPDSWTTIDPSTITDAADYNAFAPLMQDFLDANPALVDSFANAMLAQVLPPGFPTAPKFRGGVAAGIGLMIKGFGLGVATIFDASIEGKSILSTVGDATLTVGFMGGYAHEFKFSDSFGLKVGGLLRPMFRMNSPVAVSGVLNAFSVDGGFNVDGLVDTLFARYGTGIGIDVGAILGIGPLNVGLAISDLFDTRFNYQQTSLRDLYDEVSDGDEVMLPAGTPDETKRYVIPMDVRVGASFHPNLGALSFFIDPSVHLQIGNFLTVAREAKMAADNGVDYAASFGDLVAFGAEVRLLRILAVRAGYYQGAISAGLGAHLLFLDANVSAYIAPKAGESVGNAGGLSDLGDVGITAELAIRF